jgi:hypothetical protein
MGVKTLPGFLDLQLPNVQQQCNDIHLRTWGVTMQLLLKVERFDRPRKVCDGKRLVGSENGAWLAANHMSCTLPRLRCLLLFCL